MCTAYIELNEPTTTLHCYKYKINESNHHNNKRASHFCTFQKCCLCVFMTLYVLPSMNEYDNDNENKHN